MRPVLNLRFVPAALVLAVAGLVAACGGDAPPPPADTAPDLSPPAADATAPASFRVRIETSKGAFVAEFVRDWAPRGVDRVYTMVQRGYFTDVRFFRVVPGFVAQFGMHGDPAVNDQWRVRRLMDDPVHETNRRGTITFAAATAPNTRSNQLFINLADNTGLDGLGFAPVGRVVEGMATVDALFGGYGETPSGNQSQIGLDGNAYLMREFPNLDYIRSATIVGG